MISTCHITNAQPIMRTQDSANTETRYLSKGGILRLANNKFGGLATGQSNSANLVNYASFNPIAGSFNFNGSFPIGKDNDSARFSFLSFKISGDLISESYAALFQNMKLNTNISLSGQWDFRLSKGFHYTYLASDKFNHNQKVQTIESQWTEKNVRLSSQYANILRDSNNIRTKILIADSSIRRHNDTLARVQNLLNNLRTSSPDSLDRIKLFYDSLSKQKTKIEEVEKDRWAAIAQADSLQNITADLIGFILASQRKYDDDRKSKIRLLEDSAAITGIKFNWLTLYASTGRKNYHTFNPMEVFANQIQKLESNPWKIGIVYNHYSERSFPRRVLLWNIGVYRYEDNNLALLSTQDIEQEKVIKNATGDTTRTISKTYKAYTDGIITSKVLNFVSNIYFLYSSKKSGFHLYPSLDVYDKGKTLANVGLGYLISFKNTEKEKPVINAEGYIQFVDITNALDTGKPFLKRSEIGIRFALPFTFFN